LVYVYLQLPVQSVSAYHHKSCEFEPRPWPGVLDAILSDNICQWLAIGQWFSLGTLVSSESVFAPQLYS
jgi:hypothetical protein